MEPDAHARRVQRRRQRRLGSRRRAACHRHGWRRLHPVPRILHGGAGAEGDTRTHPERDVPRRFRELCLRRTHDPHGGGPGSADIRDGRAIGRRPYAVTEFGDRPGVPGRPVDAGAKGLRIAWLPHVGVTRTDPAVLSLTRDTVVSLEQQGACVEEIADPCFDDVFATYVVIATVAHATRLEALAAAAADRMDASLRASIARGAAYSATDLQRAGDRRTALFRSVQHLFERFDIIATPTMTAPPPRVDAGGSIRLRDVCAMGGAPLPVQLDRTPRCVRACWPDRGGLARRSAACRTLARRAASSGLVPAVGAAPRAGIHMAADGGLS